MKRLAALILFALVASASAATTVVSRVVVANTNDAIVSHTNLTLSGRLAVGVGVVFPDATTQTTASVGGGGVSTNAVAKTGDTMTGALTVPNIYGVTATTQLLISAGGGVANSTLRLRGGSDTSEGGPVIIEVGDDTIDTWGYFRVEMPNSEGSLFSVDQYGATFHGLRLTNTIFEGDGSGLTGITASVTGAYLSTAGGVVTGTLKVTGNGGAGILNMVSGAPFYEHHFYNDGGRPRWDTNFLARVAGNGTLIDTLNTLTATGTITAAGFVGDGSGLTNLPNSGSGGSAFRVALLPGAASSGYGSTNDATMMSRAGTNASWTELQFSSAGNQRARWAMPAAQTLALAGGSVTARVSWYAGSTTGSAVWALSLRTVNPGATMDAAYGEARLVTNASGASPNGLAFAEWVFSPATNELKAGQMTLLQLQRNRTNSSDTVGTNCNVIGVSLWQ
jgi:hypothetical protein